MNFPNNHRMSAVLVLLLLVFFTSCQSDTEATTTGENTTEVDPSTLDFKRHDNTVYVNLPQEPRSLNPWMTTQGYSRYVHRHIIQTLNDIDPESFAPVPMLASLPNVFARPDGGIDYTFDINEDAHWPDGTPVTADDVVFSLKILFDPLLAPVGPYRGYYNMIDGVTMTPANAKRIKIGTNKPYILSEAALGSIPVYPAYAYDPDKLLSQVRLSDLLDPAKAKILSENDDNLIKFSEQFSDPMYASEPGKVVGSGPYQLTSWEAGQKLRLEKVENYWADGASEPWLANEPDAIEYQFIKEGTTVANALRDQEFDAVVELEVAKFRELRDEPQTARYYNFNNEQGFVYNSLMLNNADPILKDQRVRRALAHLTDVEALIENNYGNLATRITTPILPQKPYYNTSLEPIEYSPEQAIALLEQAGWTDSNGNGILDKVIDGELTELQLSINAFTTEVANNIALMMQQSAKTAGVDLQIVPMDGRALYGSLNKGEFQIATVAAGSEPIPDDLTQVFSTSSIPPNGGNRMRYGDAESDALIQQIRGTLDVSKRNELYRRLQKKIYDDQPLIFLFSVDGRTITSKRFEATTSSLSPGFRANTFVQKAWNKQ